MEKVFHPHRRPTRHLINCFFYNPVRDTVSLAPGCNVLGGDPVELQGACLPDENDKSP